MARADREGRPDASAEQVDVGLRRRHAWQARAWLVSCLVLSVVILMWAPLCLPMGLCLSQAAICVYTGLVGSWVARSGSNPNAVRPDNDYDSRVLGLGFASVLVAGLSIFNAVAAHAIGELRFLFPADMPREKARLESWFTFGIPFTIITFGLVSVALSIVAIDLIRKHRGST